MKKHVKRLILALFLLGIIGWGLLKWTHVSSFVGKLSGRQVQVHTIEFQGNVEVREVRVGFKIRGRIERMYVDEGERVKKGQLLAELDPTDFYIAQQKAQASVRSREAELEKLKNGPLPDEIVRAKARTQQARSELELAEKEYMRAKKLYEEELISQNKFEFFLTKWKLAQSQLRALESSQKLIERGARQEDIKKMEALLKLALAQLEEANQKLRDAKLFSPVDGLIQTRVHEPGEYIQAGIPVYIISIDEPLWIRTYVNERELERVYPGMGVRIVTDTGREYKGRIGYISPNAEFTPRTVQTREVRTDLVYRMRIIVHEAKTLRQGMPVTILIPQNNE